jgi:hypothetical protein
MTFKSIWLSLGLRFALIAVILVWTLTFLHRSVERPAFVQRSYCISDGFSDQEKQMIREGAAIWDYRAPEARFVERCEPNAIQVKIPFGEKRRWITSTYDHPGLWTMGLHEPATNTIWLMEDRVSRMSELRVFASHEFGHVMNLPDLSIEHPAIMNEAIRHEVETDFHLYEDDITFLCKEQACR